jgi:hypothetical protein
MMRNDITLLGKKKLNFTLEFHMIDVVLFSIILEYILKKLIDVSFTKKKYLNDILKKVQHGYLQTNFNPNAMKHQAFKGNDTII